MAVLGSVAIIAGAWALFTAVGVVCLTLLPAARHRAELVPAAPAIGLLGVIVVLHLTSIVLPVPPGAAIAAALALGPTLHPTVRARLRQNNRRTLASLGIAALLGVPAAGIGLLPLRHADRPTVVQATPNNDAYAFVTEADWLQHHSAIDEPSRSSIPIGYQYVRHHISHGLRIGQELAIDTVATLSAQPVDELYYPMTVLWVALIPGVIIAVCGILGIRRSTAALAGVALSLGSLEMYQLINENSAAALGVAVAPLALAAVADALDVLPGRTRLPLLAAPLVLAGVVGAYAEYTPLLLPTFLFVAVGRRPSAIPRALLRLALVVALSVVVAPLAWWHAATGTLFHFGEPFLGWVSPFLSASPEQFAVRWIGGGDLINLGADRSRLALLVFGAAAAGIAIAVAIAPRRRLWCALLLASALLITYLSTVRRITYSEQRAVLYSQPLLLLAAAAGFDALLLRLSVLRDRGMHQVATAVLAASVLAFTVLNVNSDRALAAADAATLAHRTVDADFSDVAALTRRHAGAQGADLLVVSGDFFDQLWLAYTLRDRPAVSWATFEPAYVDIGVCRYNGPSPLWDGRLRRFLLVDRLSLLSAPAGSIVAQDDRFTLLRTDRGAVAVATVPQVVAGRRGEISIDGPADMLVLDGGADVVAIHGSNPRGAPATVRVGTVGRPAHRVSTTTIPIDLVGTATRVELTPERQTPGTALVLDGIGPSPTTATAARLPPLPTPCD